VGPDHREYQPDFVAEAEDCIYMLEPKAIADLDDPEVKLKREVAVTWCRLAGHYLSSSSGVNSGCH